MDKSRSNLLFLGVGLALGAAVGYVLSSDKAKRDAWIKEATNLVGKVRSNICRDRSHEEDVEDNA